jgi:hypothetical protein
MEKTENGKTQEYVQEGMGTDQQRSGPIATRNVSDKEQDTVGVPGAGMQT